MPTNAAWPNEVAPPMPVSSTRPSATRVPMPMSLSSETPNLPSSQRREHDRGDEHRDRGAMPALRRHSSISSSSSSAWTEKKDLASSTGISRLKTITSLSAPLQNEAKLSTTPTAIAPSAVSG